MSRLPTPGGDQDNWGNVLNDFLSQAHNTDGTLKAGSVGASQVQDASIPKTKLDASTQTAVDAVASKYTKPAGGIPKTDLDSSTQSTLDGAAVAILTTTAVKTSNYSAAGGDFIPVDTSSGNITITLPTAPANKTRVGAKLVIQGGSNTVTVVAGGSDIFNKAGGSTTLTLQLVNQSVILQYASSGAIWYVTSDDLPLTQIDTRFVATTGGGKEGLSSSTASSGSTTVNLANGNVQKVTLSVSTTLALTGSTASTACSLSLYLVQDATGSRTVSWPASVKWPSAIAPTLSTGANKVDLVVLETLDGGTTWYGTFAGADFR
jgi:hypothetical protein